MRFSKDLAVAAVVGLVGGVAAPGIAAAGTEPSWVIQATPSPGGTGVRLGSVLLAVSCPSATACTAVGGYTPNPRAIVPLAERWNGRKWAVQTMPRVKDAVLFGVSCWSVRACTAVGYSPKGTLADRWNGRKWVVQPTPNPSGSKGSELVGVSCSSAKACTAVGSYGKKTLAERWNGTKWAIQATPNPSHAAVSLLTGLSCSSATACTAVGPSVMRSGAEPTLAERYS